MSQEGKIALFENTKAWRDLPHALLEELAQVMEPEEV
jgi:hypothetical protein